VTLKVGFKTDLGRSRALNEDNLLVDLELGLFVVADGLGGHDAGELASSIAVAEIASHVREQISQGEETRRVVEQAIIKANAEIRKSGPTGLDEAEMGSTVVLALLRGNRALISHVGDSRAYMITNGAMKQLTHDHTFVADWVRQGSITVEEARTHESRHGLYAALGVEDGIEPETAEWPWDPDSCLLLCSDGLTDMLTDDGIAAIVNGSASPQQACDLLVEAANEMGGTDNISVIIVRQTDKHPE
jgi:serine/threonine protein phosphatase PrpC